MREKVVKCLEYISGTFFFIMIVLVLYQVIMRKIFNASPSWTEELARYSIIWSTLLMCPALIAKKGHIMLDYFVEMMPPAAKKMVETVTGIVAVVLISCFLYGGYGMIKTSIAVTQNSPGAQIPMWIVYVVLPLSGVLMLLAQLITMIENFTKKSDTPR